MKKKSELRRNWLIVLASCIGVGAGVTGIPFYTLGFFVEPLRTEFGWTGTQVQGMFSVFTFTGLLIVPVIGWLTDKYGVRRVALYSLAGAVIAYCFLGWATSTLTTYYLGAALLALLATGTGPITWTKMIGGWFDRQRGLALGLTLAGTGIAGFLAPQYVSWIIGKFGWREAYIGLALIPLCAIPIVYLFLKDPPGTDKASALQAHDQATTSTSGLDLKTAASRYQFWVIAVAFFLVSIGIAGSIPNLVPLLMNASIERSTAASLLGVIGIAVISGRIIAGFVLDKFWAPAVASVMLALPIISALILSQASLSIPAVTLAIVLIGFAAGAEFDLIAYLVTRYFGLAHYGKIYSWQYAAFALGAGIAPPLFAYVYEQQGSYTNIMYLAAGLFLCGSLLLLTLGPYPKAFQTNEV